MNQADFARLHGVSRKTVTAWKHQGRIVMRGANVDVQSSEARLRDAGLGRFRDLADDAEAVDLPVPIPGTEADPETMAAFLTGLLNGKFGDRSTAEKIKENALAGLRALELQTKAGTLMEVADAETLFFQMARSERDAWMNWPARVGPELAARLDIPADTVTAELVRLVHAELAGRGEPEADFGPRAN